MWLAWWVLLMPLWVAVDDSLRPDEPLAGAAAAGLAALAAEVAGHLTGTRYRIRVAWLARALALPGDVLRDTILVFTVLARTGLGEVPPPGGYREVPVSYGDATPLGATRRVLLTAGFLVPGVMGAGFPVRLQPTITSVRCGYQHRCLPMVRSVSR